MTFVIGFIIWTAMGIAAALVIPAIYRGPTTTSFLSLAFGVFGAFAGGMLGVAPYVTHDPSPLRLGALLGALVGAFFTTFLYHLVARKAL